MKEQEFQELKLIIAFAADYYGRVLKPEVLVMMANDLRDLDLCEIKKAFEVYRINSKNLRFPLPAEIREIILPQVNTKNAAETLASKIISAIKKHDVYWQMELKEKFDETILEAFGIPGSSVIQRRGGWSVFCNEFWASDADTFRAQLRDECEANIKYPIDILERAALGKSSFPDLLRISEAKDLNKLLSRKENN